MRKRVEGSRGDTGTKRSGYMSDRQEQLTLAVSPRPKELRSGKSY